MRDRSLPLQRHTKKKQLGSQNLIEKHNTEELMDIFALYSARAYMPEVFQQSIKQDECTAGRIHYINDITMY